MTGFFNMLHTAAGITEQTEVLHSPRWSVTSSQCFQPNFDHYFPIARLVRSVTPILTSLVNPLHLYLQRLLEAANDGDQ